MVQGAMQHGTMQPLRVRVQLGWTPSRRHAAKFWWQPAPEALTVGDLLEEVGAHLGLEPRQRSSLIANMGGFAVLSSSKTELLRDGDTLVICQDRKRGAAAAFAAAADEGPPPAKKRGVGGSSSGAEGEEAAGTTSSEPTGSSSSSDDDEEEEVEVGDSSSSEDGEDSASSSSTSSSSEDREAAGKAAAGITSMGFQTPANKATPGTAGTQPSRSARRKAAKRRLRRMGMLPQGNRQPAAAAAAAATGAAIAAGKDVATNGAAGLANKPQVASRVLAGGSKQAGKSPAAAAASQGQRQGKAPKDSSQGQQYTQQHEQAAQPTAVTAAAAAPEVAVPPEWQQPRGAAQHLRQRKQQGEQHQHQAASPAAGAGVQPMVEAAFAQLPLVAGGACVDDVLAYKLLEIGFGMQPVVSEVRCGRVTAVEGDTLTLEPHPDPSLHPLSYQRALCLAERQAQADWWEQEDIDDEDDADLGAYDEAGTLTVNLSSFVELRVLRQATRARHTAGTPLAAAPPASGSSKPAEAADLGPCSYSQLGPPRPASSKGDVIAPEGGWASLYEQLARRRAQLATDAAAEGASTPHAAPKANAPSAVHSAPPAAAGSRGGNGMAAGRSSSLTPGATRPRAGVRRTALGPMLRILRDSQALDVTE